MTAPQAPQDEPLRPRLRQVQDTLEERLDEVCDAPAADDLSTNELIRIEESLAIATDAAKEAVSLRRKLHRNRDDAEDSRARFADAAQREETPSEKSDVPRDDGPPGRSA